MANAAASAKRDARPGRTQALNQVQSVKQPCGYDARKKRGDGVAGPRQAAMSFRSALLGRRPSSEGQLEPRGSATPGVFSPLLGLGSGHGSHRSTGWPQCLPARPGAVVAAQVSGRSPFRDLEDAAGSSPLPAFPTPAHLPFQTSGTSPHEAGARKLGAILVDRKCGQRFPRAVHMRGRGSAENWGGKSGGYSPSELPLRCQFEEG